MGKLENILQKKIDKFIIRKLNSSLYNIYVYIFLNKNTFVVYILLDSQITTSNLNNKINLLLRLNIPIKIILL